MLLTAGAASGQDADMRPSVLLGTFLVSMLLVPVLVPAGCSSRGQHRGGPGQLDAASGPDAAADSGTAGDAAVDSGVALDGGPGDAGLPPRDGAAGGEDGEQAADGDAPVPDGGGSGPRCTVPAARLDVPLDLLPDAPATQIHAALAADGEAIWLTYSVPEADGSGGFDVWAVRLRCDGTPDGPPRALQTADQGNDVDPVVAAAHGRLSFAWSTDAGGIPNMWLQVRSFDAEMAPLGAEQRVQPWWDGAPLDGNGLSPRLAILPDGELLLAGLWGVPEAPGFQLVLQRLAADGALARRADGQPEAAVAAWLEPGADESNPAMALLPDGTVHLAWTRTDAAGASRVLHGRLAPGAARLDPDPPVEVIPRIASAAPDLAVDPGLDRDAPVYMVFQRAGGEQDVFLQLASALQPEAPFLVFGQERRVDHSPAVAARAGGGLVGWYRQRAGLRNDVLVRGFSFDGERFAATGEERLLNPPDEAEGGDEHAAAPYGLALAHVGDGVFLVVWSEGRSPDFRLRGRFVRP